MIWCQQHENRFILQYKSRDLGRSHLCYPPPWVSLQCWTLLAPLLCRNPFVWFWGKAVCAFCLVAPIWSFCHLFLFISTHKHRCSTCALSSFNLKSYPFLSWVCWSPWCRSLTNQDSWWWPFSLNTYHRSNNSKLLSSWGFHLFFKLYKFIQEFRIFPFKPASVPPLYPTHFWLWYKT